MTSHDEQRLSDALRRQAETQDPHLLTLDDVTSRAGSIRRRRVAAGVVAAAAVVAVVVPTALVAGDRRTDSTPPPVATNTPTPSVTQDVTIDPSPTDPVTPADKHLTVRITPDLPTGEGPRIPVRVGEEVVTSDGVVGTVGTNAVYFSPVGKGFVAVVRVEGSEQGRFQVRDAAGNLLLEKPANIDGALAVTPDQTAAAYVGADGRIHTWSETDGDLTFSEPLKDVQLGPMTGSRTCKEQAPEGGGCSVVVNKPQGAAIYSSHGPGGDLRPVLKVNSASEKSYAAQTTSEPEGSCSEVRRIADDRTIAATCDNTLGSFSSDGAYVIGGSAYLDGLCCTTADILDAANLTSLITIDYRGGADSAHIQRVGWEDASHVLAVLYDGQRWRIVRVGLDGSAEWADTGADMPKGDVGETPVALPVGA